MADILENPVDLIDDAYEQEIQVEQEMIEVVAYRSYNRLDDKPQINGVELVGNKTSSDLGITAQIESAVNSEAQARAQADNTLQGKIDTEKLARQQADSTLQGNIDAEETARKAADKDIQDVLDGETLARQNADTALGGRIDTEIHDRQVADIALQGQIDAITSKSDVVDVVANYVALQAYDTSSLGNNDVIKVLDDETHEDALTYYRWSTTTQTWTYIGQEAPYYSKSQTDTLLLGKQNTIDSSHKLSADLVDDTSTTNKFVTASDITNWNGKQDALTAGAGIDITGGVISTPAIVPEVVAELPATGEEGKLYLTPKAHTTQTATGNPITATVAEEAGAIESFQLDGDTFQQSYTGQNLYNVAQVSSGTYVTKDDDGWITITRNNTSGDSTVYTNLWTSNLALETSTQYKIFIEVKAVSGTGSLFVTSTNSTQGQFNSWQEKNLANMVAGQTYTVAPTTKSSFSGISQGLRTVFQLTAGQGGSVTFRLSVCASSTPTETFSYEPYTGGEASPSPDYPQPIQTVTGTQTISINGTGYPLNLGTIELCKLGTYQDYIWKDGGDWKVHKECDSGTSDIQINGIDINSSGTSTASRVGSFCSLRADNPSIDYDNTLGRAIASENIGIYKLDASVIGNAAAESMQDGTFCQRQGTNDRVYFKNSAYAGKTGEEIRAIIAAQLGGTNYWYPLATPTDTTITDQTLISQLEAIRTASLKNGTNTITNTATGTNLAGDMEIGYYGFNPTNRYDKWLWLDINNEYEQIGS